MATSDPEERSPSFFKVIRDPSSPLSLPKAFVRRYFEKIPKSPVLVSVTGKHSWRVEFEKIGEEYCFGNGWEKLVEDVGLCVRDVVIFWMIDAFKFCVSILGANGCEKDLPLYKINDDDDVDDDDEVMTGENLCYKKVFRRSFKYYMSLAPRCSFVFKRVQRVVHINSATPKNDNYVFSRIGFAIQKQLVARLPASLL